MQGQTKANLAITSAKLFVVWGAFGAMLAKVILEDGFGADADIAARGIQAGALLAALLSIGCYAIILRWRRLALVNYEATGLGVSPEEHQVFFHTRATWFVWGATGLFLAVAVLVGMARGREAQASNEKAMAASAKEITFPPCKAVGMIAYQMASKRDQSVSKEEMQRRYQPNEIMDRKVWGRMVDMVYDHPEKAPEAIERAFASQC